MKKLILFYSYSGNTRKVAEMIQKEIGGDLAEIKTVIPYEGDYNAVVDQGKAEIDSGFMPELQTFDLDLEAYDTIILGTPVWWYTFAPAIRTFLNSNHLKDKSVYPFATNGGWLGHTFKDMEKTCPQADFKEGLNIRFNGVRLETSLSDIHNWIKNIQ